MNAISRSYNQLLDIAHHTCNGDEKFRIETRLQRLILEILYENPGGITKSKIFRILNKCVKLQVVGDQLMILHIWQYKVTYFGRDDRARWYLTGKGRQAVTNLEQ